ncbi:MAG: MarR family transcriptional regulator [Pseudomonadota bacterium]
MKKPTQAETEDEVISTPMRNADGFRFDMVEQLFFAYRDFTKGPDIILSDLGFGRAHHRVLYFVNRVPGIRVTDLLGILNITKQSLARVLKDLIESQFIVQRSSPSDRRERLLYPTKKGRDLALALSESQSRRIEQALEEVGPVGAQAAKKFLQLLIDEADQSTIRRLEEM